MEATDKDSPEAINARAQKKFNAMLRGEIEPSRPRKTPAALFTTFDPDQAKLAGDLAYQAAKRADAVGDELGLDAAADFFLDELGQHSLGLVEHAAKLFITHHALARSKLYILPLEQRISGPRPNL